MAQSREYFLHKIGELRRPKTNVQMIQKNAMLKFSHLFHFLMESAPAIAEEVQSTYVESMSRTLHGLFRAYHTQLVRLQLEVANRHDLIAVEENAVRSLFSTKVDLSKRTDAFTLNDRGAILEEIDVGPVLVHVAVAEGRRFPYEAIFRSIQKHLMDAATSEYLFCLDFFNAASHSRDLFNRIFARTLSLCLEQLENYLFSCHDAIGLLLMIRLTHSHRMVMERRRIPCLDNFFDRVNLLLWPRFKAIFGANLRSVRSANPRKLGAIEMTPHYITRRYSEFSAAVLTLHNSFEGCNFGTGDEMLLNDLATLRAEMVGLLGRLSDELPTAKGKMVFLINNYDQVLSLFQERRILSEETTRFEELLSQQREQFVEEELLVSFGRMIAFVQQTEAQMADGGGSAAGASSSSSSPVDTALVETLVRDFAASWKSGIEQINHDVMEYFSNFRNGMEILKQVLTQLLLYYTRFQDIIRRCWRRPPPFSKDIVTTQAILAEIKKYSRNV